MQESPTSQRPTRSTSAPWLVGGVLGLALGYFFWYTPYAAMTKSLSSGLLPGLDGDINGLVLLPAAALGTLVGVVLFNLATGWWRFAGTRSVLGRKVPVPSRTMAVAGLFTALVIGATTLNYTFAGVSILLTLLMMRAGVLILAPLVDAARRRKVRIYSWVALGLSLLAVVTALSDVDSYRLTGAAVLSLGFYFVGYIGRFEIMSRVAKTGDTDVDRRYFAEEQISSAVWQVGLCAVFAVVGVGSGMAALREGFTSFLFTPAAIAAFGIGLLYAALYVYGTLIYLDRREYTWCVPLNRCASLLSGLVASFGLTWLTGIAAPGNGQLVGTGFVVLAVAALSYPAFLSARAVSVPVVEGAKMLLFVCGANTCRSAMAAAIARAQLAAARPAERWQVVSAGLTARAGDPIARSAKRALQEVGVDPGGHRARPLTPDLIARADVVYCMTAAQRDAILEIAPDAAAKIVRLDPDADVPEVATRARAAYRELATRLQDLVGRKLAAHGAAAPRPAPDRA